jgi:hypothetical protein
MHARRFVFVLGLAFGRLTFGCVSELDPDAPHAVDGADESLAGQDGLRATYFRNVDLTGAALTRVDAIVDFDWGRDAPASGLPVDGFSARWEGFYLAAETGPHRFAVRSDDGVRLFVGDDPEPLVENWRNQAATTVRGTIDLVAGELYPLRIEYYDSRGTALMELRCAPPSLPAGANEPLVPRTQLRTERPAAEPGLVGSYFRSRDFSGEPLVRVDPTVDFDWGRGAADPSLPVDAFSVRWQGVYVAERSGLHRFAVTSDDGLRLWVGDLARAPLLEGWRSGPVTLRGEIELVAGRAYPIRLEYYDDRGAATVQLRHVPPGASTETVVPSARLRTRAPAAPPPTSLQNVALRKPASQISVDFGASADRAVDGNTSGRFDGRSVTHTTSTTRPWWLVDLDGRHRVERVTIFNRTDCCAERLVDFDVELLNAADAVIATRRHAGVAGASTELTFGTDDVYAVRVRLRGNGILSLAEVQVWGAPVAPPPGGGTTRPRIPLPIEVMGPAGTRVSAQFQIDDPTGITHLYVRCNACGYHEEALDADASKVKATVRLNGGSAIPLKHYTGGSRLVGNPNVEVIGAEADYGGIGGAFRTTRLRVPVSGLVRGLNTITFEHVTPAPPSIGFRILDVNFLRRGSLTDRVLAERDVVHDDPTTWRPPSTNDANVTAGRNLWSARNRLYDPGVDALDGRLGGGPVDGEIVASCADCHARDARDLAYFNFSNHSIIERAKFHRLSAADGANIASYVRTRDVSVVRSARPWNPTYQPGRGLDARPAYEWAAGAGVDAILDRDADLAPLLFPRGTSLDEVRRVVDRYGMLNLRELPVSLPMPEWNQWLPHIHPDDAFDIDAAAVRADHSGNGVGRPYYTYLYDVARADPNPTTIGRMTIRIKAWLQRNLNCMANGESGNGEPWRGLNGAVLTQLRLPTPHTFTSSNCEGTRTRANVEPFEIAKRGLAAWLSVKQWEIVHSNDLEEEGLRMTSPICAGGRCVNAAERGWVAEGRNVFDRPPHFTGHNSRHYYGQSMVSGLVETNSWYHLNMILDPGYRRAMPNHFAYVYSHVELLQSASDVDQGYRFWAGLIKQRQLQTNGRYGVEEGLDLRTAQPYIYFSPRDGRSNAQDSVGATLHARLAQAMIENFVADANNATAANWAAATRNSAVQPRDSTNFSAAPARGNIFDLGPLQGRNTYRAIPRLRDIGVAPSVISSLIDWGARTWPRANWNALR